MTQCDVCLCTEHDIKQCESIVQAKSWLLENQPETVGLMFETVAEMYESVRPNQFRPFMMAWCDMFGGI